MACGGCGKKSQGISRQPVNRNISVARVGRPANTSPRTRAVNTVPSTGVRAQAVRRCSKCSWPMNSMRKFDNTTGKQVQIWVCMNRKCMRREEA